MNLGIPYILSSVFCFASITVLLKKASMSTTTSTIIMVSSGSLFIISAVVSFFVLQRTDVTQVFNKKEMILTLVLVGILNYIGLLGSVLSLDYFHVGQQTMFKVLVPFVASVLAYFLLGETLEMKFFIGLTFVSLGLFISTC